MANQLHSNFIKLIRFAVIMVLVKYYLSIDPISFVTVSY